MRDGLFLNDHEYEYDRLNPTTPNDFELMELEAAKISEKLESLTGVVININGRVDADYFKNVDASIDYLLELIGRLKDKSFGNHPLYPNE